MWVWPHQFQLLDVVGFLASLLSDVGLLGLNESAQVQFSLGFLVLVQCGGSCSIILDLRNDILLLRQDVLQLLLVNLRVKRSH